MIGDAHIYPSSMPMSNMSSCNSRCEPIVSETARRFRDPAFPKEAPAFRSLEMLHLSSF